jgi:hypothetical protein
VGFSDRLRAWLRGESGASGASGRSSAGASPSQPRTSRRRGERKVSLEGLDEFVAFATTRRGVEGYLEPRTNLYSHSMLLVADDGEYLRRPIADPATARAFCASHGLPLYDAARVGYPRRVRDYDRGVRPQRVDLADLPPWPDSDGRSEDSTDGEQEPPPPPPV